MTEQIRYKCACCGKQHTSWPALAYKAPSEYDQLFEEEKQSIGSLTSDFCIINYGDQTDRFIRVVLNQKVIDHCEDLQYGLWVSLSEASFEDYSGHYKDPNHQTQYFGWLSNNIPEYEFNEFIPCTVVTQVDDRRPVIHPHHDFDHPLVYDYYNGITKEEAEKRIKSMLAKTEIKKWWKFW